MKVKKTRQGSPYRCQSKASYVALEILALFASFLGGSGVSGSRWYLVEARLPYDGKLGFKCKSKVGFRINESQVNNKSPDLQKKLLYSYMDLTHGPGSESSDLRIEKALLPAICSVQDAYPEITVAPGQAISIQIRKTARWEISEVIVDQVYSRLTQEVHRLKLALSQIEASV